MPNYLKHYIHVNPPTNELQALYFSRTMRAVSMGMIGIFIPIYLLDSGFEFRQVILFMLGMEMIRYIFTKPVGLLMAKIGVEIVLVTSFIFSILSFIFLANIENGMPEVFAAQIITGIALAAFWSANHYIFMMGHNKRRTGRQASGLIIGTRIGVAIGPLIGGVVASQFGFEYVFYAGIISMVLAVFPFAYIIRKKHYPIPDYNEDLLNKYNFKPQKIAMFAHGYEATAANYLWPFFIFLFVDSYQAIGLIVSLSFLLALAITYAAGKMSDKGKSKKEMDFGSVAISGIDTTRTLVDTATSAFGVNLLNNIFYGLLIIPFAHSLYENADKLRLAYIIKIEQYSAMGHTLLWLSVGLLTLFLKVKIAIIFAFLLAAGAAMVMRLMARPLVKN